MGNNFFAYLRLLEIMAFFSGYPLVYSVTVLIAGNPVTKNNLRGRVVSLLPFAYALIGTLFLGLQLKYLYHAYISGNFISIWQQPYLSIWGLLSLLFWIPYLARKIYLSLLHNLVFFFFLIKDLYLQLFFFAEKDILRNDMQVFTISILLNIGALVLVTFVYSLIRPFNKNKFT